jgi:hypothetical protein
MFGSMLGTSLGIAVSFWIASMIDGIINMNRIYNLIYKKNNNEKAKGVKIRFALDIR